MLDIFENKLEVKKAKKSNLKGQWTEVSYCQKPFFFVKLGLRSDRMYQAVREIETKYFAIEQCLAFPPAS